AYWTHEIATYLDISNSTLRKWCIELEKQGYTFTKSENGSRAYLVRDRDLLLILKQQLRTGTGTGKVTVKGAVQQALFEFDKLTTNAQRMTSKTLKRWAFV